MLRVSKRIWQWSYMVLMVALVGGVSRWYLGGERYMHQQPIIQENQQIGLHFQVNPVMIGKETALFISELSKIDGSSFEEGLDAYEFEYTKEGSSRGSATMQKGLSEDRKTIRMVLEMNYEDLHQIQSVTIGVSEVIGEGGNYFKITTPVVQNYKNQSIKLNKEITVGGNQIVIKEMILDTFQVIIKGTQGEEGRKIALLDEGIVALQMKDGELVELKAHNIEDIYEKQFEYRFEQVTIDEVDGIAIPRVFDPKDIEALVIGNEIIKVSE